MSDGVATYGFRYGVDMDPTLVRRAAPAARFVARARLVDGEAPFQVAGEGEEAGVWGIVLELPAEAARGKAATVVTDDGRTVAAAILTAPEDVADQDATIAAARYWELPPDYIRRLGGLEEDVTEG